MTRWEEIQREKMREKMIEDQAAKASMSGFASGAILNPLFDAVKGGLRGWPQLVKSALLGGIGYGAAAGGANYIGGQAFGPVRDDEWSPNTDRGMAGGALGGGAMGGVLGGLASSPLMPKSALGRMGDNLVLKQFAKFAGQPKGMGKGALLGAGLGALSGGFIGSDEGMQLDFIQDQLDKTQREKMLKEQIRGRNI